jgi:glutamate formiminotransferase / formiminotetrahydrofolate cyclodeaminase
MKLFECVPNFSDGRNADVIKAILSAVEATPGAVVLDLESDASHNRSVLTFVGEGDAVVEAAFRASRVAVEKIDLNHHKGEHPRMGAMDVVPFIPLGEATVEEAIALARRFGARLAKELEVPVYYYGQAATRPERSELPKVREGQFEGIRESIQKDPARAPDEGAPRVHPTAGATAVGVRPVLVAYNIYLNTPDASVAKRIAKAIRGRDGGLAEVRALGFEIAERHQAQVSMNMTDVRRTPLHRAFEMVQTEAARYGAGIVESEIVGLVPEDALVEAAEHYLRLNSFDRHLLLERRVRERLSGGALGPSDKASPLVTGAVAQFIGSLAARTATPGGGSAAALAGAMGGALVEMVLRYATPADQIPPTTAAKLGELATLREALTKGIDEDARSYEGVRTARAARKKNPQGEAEQKALRAALVHATEIPLETAERVAAVQAILAEMRAVVKPIFASDALTAEVLLVAAKKGAIANAEVNLATLREGGESDPELTARVARVSSSP